jgi:hypothetical protein
MTKKVVAPLGFCFCHFFVIGISSFQPHGFVKMMIETPEMDLCSPVEKSNLRSKNVEHPTSNIQRTTADAGKISTFDVGCFCER